MLLGQSCYPETAYPACRASFSIRYWTKMVNTCGLRLNQKMKFGNLVLKVILVIWIAPNAFSKCVPYVEVSPKGACIIYDIKNCQDSSKVDTCKVVSKDFRYYKIELLFRIKAFFLLCTIFLIQQLIFKVLFCFETLLVVVPAFDTIAHRTVGKAAAAKAQVVQLQQDKLHKPGGFQQLIQVLDLPASAQVAAQVKLLNMSNALSIKYQYFILNFRLGCSKSAAACQHNRPKWSPAEIYH